MGGLAAAISCARSAERGARSATSADRKKNGLANRVRHMMESPRKRENGHGVLIWFSGGHNTGGLSAAVFQNGAAAAQVCLLIGVEQSMPKINKIEINIVDASAPQIGMAQIGFADLLRGFEVLLVVVVGVKTGPASLAGDRTAYQAIARGA